MRLCKIKFGLIGIKIILRGRKIQFQESGFNEY